MIPVLYRQKERTFKTNGIGRLHFIKCEVKEKMNGEFELEGELPIRDKHFKDVMNDRIIVASCEVDNNNQAFRIYEVEKSSEETCTIRAEHISYWLSRIPVFPFEAMTAKDTVDRIMERTMEENPFTIYTNVTRHPYVWTADNDEIEIFKESEDYPEPLIVNQLDMESKKPAELRPDEPKSVRSFFGDDEKAGLLGVFKSGEWKFDNFNCSLLERRGHDTDIIIRYGKNLKTLTQEENIQNTITGLVPFYKHTCQRKANEDFSEEDKKRYLSADSIVRTRDIFIPPYGQLGQFLYPGTEADDGIQDPPGGHTNQAKRMMRAPAANAEEEGGDSESGGDDDPGTVERTVWCMLEHPHTWHTDNVQRFAFPRDEVIDCSSVFDHSPSKHDLWMYTQAYADQQNIGIPELNLKMDFEHLWELDERTLISNLERLHMGDSIQVVFPKLDVSATGEVIEYTWDVLTNRYTDITVGNVTHSLVDTIMNLTRATAKEELKYVATKWEQIEHGITVLNQLYYKGTGDKTGPAT